MADAIKSIENKQELIFKVLNQVVENLSNMRQNIFDHQQISQVDLMLKSQASMIQQHVEETMDKRDSELKKWLMQYFDQKTLKAQ